MTQTDLTIVTAASIRIPVWYHNTAGFVWMRPDGRYANYAVPDTKRTREMLLTPVRAQYPQASLEETTKGDN